MDINQLIEIVKKKIKLELICEDIIIEDKSFLHKSHKQLMKKLVQKPPSMNY